MGGIAPKFYKNVSFESPKIKGRNWNIYFVFFRNPELEYLKIKSIRPILLPNKYIREIPLWVLSQQLCNKTIKACRYIYYLEWHALEKYNEWRQFNRFDDYRTPLIKVNHWVRVESNSPIFKKFRKNDLS